MCQISWWPPGGAVGPTFNHAKAWPFSRGTLEQIKKNLTLFCKNYQTLTVVICLNCVSCNSPHLNLEPPKGVVISIPQRSGIEVIGSKLSELLGVQREQRLIWEGQSLWLSCPLCFRGHASSSGPWTTVFLRTSMHKGPLGGSGHLCVQVELCTPFPLRNDVISLPQWAPWREGHIHFLVIGYGPSGGCPRIFSILDLQVS